MVVARTIGRITGGVGISRYAWALPIAITLTVQPRFWIFRVELGPFYGWVEG